MSATEHFTVTLHDPYSGWSKEVETLDFYMARGRAAEHAFLFGAAPYHDLLFTHVKDEFRNGGKVTVHLQGVEWRRQGLGIIALLATVEWRNA